MSSALQTSIKQTLFHKKKLLNINAQFIEFGKKKFNKFQISDLRYGIKAINGHEFRIGRIYCIDLKTVTGETIKIRLTSLYRIRRVQLEEKYKRILAALFDNYINDISRDFLKKFTNKIDFTLLGVAFSQEGICLSEKTEMIPWFEVGSKDYWTYYSLFSNIDPDTYKTFQYLTDWNTVILYTVSTHILKTKNLL